MGKFSNAIGIWDVKIGDISFEVKPVLDDVKKFRNLLLESSSSKDKKRLFTQFGEFMANIIVKDNEDEPIEEIKEFVEVNINVLFEEAMIAFKWTNREAMEASRKESVIDLKKQMSND